MARCPFCHREITCLYVDVTDTYRAEIIHGTLFFLWKVVEGDAENISCPECLEDFPLTYDEAEELLKGKITLVLKRDCTIKGDFAVYGDEVYKIRDERVVEDEKPPLLVLEEIDDATVAAIVQASLD